MEQIFKGNNTFDKKTEDMVTNWTKTYFNTPPTDIIPPFTENDIDKNIKNLKNNKAPGNDKITNIILKNLDKKISKILHIIYSACYKLCYFPNRWKEGEITMIYKRKGSSLDPSNYRPITLLSQLGKIFESTLEIEIRSFAESNNLIDNNQSGFRKNGSTMDNLYIVTQKIKEAFNRKRQVDGIFIDFEKCFDKVWKEGVLYKMYKLGFNKHLIHLMRSFLFNKKNYIKINGTLSDIFETLAGLPQGSILSPILFIIFISDLPLDPSITTSKFADDIAILYELKNKKSKIDKTNKKMQNYLNKINTYCKKWKLKINISKTKKISFGHITITTTQYMIDNTPLENVKEIKFLGLYLDENLNFNYHTTKIISKASCTIPLLLNMNNTKFPININTKRKIFLSSTRSILEYGHVALITNNVKKLQKNRNIPKKMSKNNHTKKLDNTK